MGFLKGNQINKGRCGKRAGRWNGGRTKHSGGYVLIYYPTEKGKYEYLNKNLKKEL